MSSLSRWSHTSFATHWSLTGFDDATGVKTWAVPVTFACDYSAESKRMTDGNGVEFTSRQIIYTERSTIKQGDMLLIGMHVGDPIAAKAFEVRSVMRDADTFEGLADDYKAVT